jgi:hypothetical protein
MASVRINANALATVARLGEEFAKSCGPGVVPVLILRLQGRAADLKRGADGRAVWEQASPGHWTVQFGSWVETPERQIAETALKVQGLYAVLDHNASSTPGCLVIGVSNDELTVQLEASREA